VSGAHDRHRVSRRGEDRVSRRAAARRQTQMRYREVVRPEAERERERGRRDAPGSRTYPLIGVLPNERKRGVVDDWRGGGTAQHALDRRERDVPRMRAKRRAGYRSPTWVRDAMQSHAPRVSPETRSVLRGNASRGRRVARPVARLRRRHGGGDARRRVRTARRRRTFSFPPRRWKKSERAKMNANNTKFESTATADRTAPDRRRGRPDRRPERILGSLRSH